MVDGNKYITFDPSYAHASVHSFGIPYDGGGGYLGTAAVPEPSSFALLGLGAMGVAIRAYRRRRMAAV